MIEEMNIHRSTLEKAFKLIAFFLVAVGLILTSIAQPVAASTPSAAPNPYTIGSGVDVIYDGCQNSYDTVNVYKSTDHFRTFYHNVCTDTNLGREIDALAPGDTTFDILEGEGWCSVNTYEECATVMKGNFVWVYGLGSTPSPTPTPTPTPTPSGTPAPTPTPTPGGTPAPTPTPTPGGTPTPTPTPGSTPTPTPTPGSTPTPTPPPGGGGGPVVVPPVPPLIDVLKVPSPLSLPNGPGRVTYTYTLRNIGTVPVTDVTMVGDTCSPIVLVSGDTSGDNRLDVHETWVHRCTTTLSATHTNIVTATGWANGISAIDIATATVVVGVPVVPPLIHVVKVPNPLTLLAGGGMVTYTEKITNPGTVALSNVRLTDDKCAAVKYVSGDLDSDSKLGTTETWTYTCRMNLTKTTTNTATASGEANGLTAKDVAIVTVVVAVPNIPTIANSPDLPDLPQGAATVTPSSGMSLFRLAATVAAAALWLILFVLAVMDIARADKATGWKLMWALVCLVFPVVGAIVYYFVARKRVSFNGGIT